MEKRKILATQKSLPYLGAHGYIPKSAPGTLRSAASSEDLSSEESASTSPSHSRSSSIDKSGPLSGSVGADNGMPMKRNRSGTNMVVVNTAADKTKPNGGSAGPQRSSSDKEMKAVVKHGSDGRPPLVVSVMQEKKLVESPSDSSLDSSANSKTKRSPREGEEKPKKKKRSKVDLLDGSAPQSPETPREKDKDKEKKRKKKRSPSVGEMEKSKSDLSIPSATSSAPLLCIPPDVALPAPITPRKEEPDLDDLRSRSLPQLAAPAGETSPPRSSSGDAALDLLRAAAAKLESPGELNLSPRPRPAGVRATVSAQNTLRREVDVAAGKTVELIRKLGKGSFGTVWAGTLNGRSIALKQISLHDLSKDKKAQIRTQIKRELELVKPLRHDNILRYYGMFYSKESQEASLVMELVDGVALSDLIAFQTKLPEKLAALVLRQIVDSLDYLHSNYIIHRDLKPDNILVDCAGRLKLIDFGCAAGLSPTALKRRSTVGTPWYCSPEVVNSDEYDFQADIWSVGCSTIELVTGKPPYDDLNDIACLFKMAEGVTPPIPAGLSPSCVDFLTQTLKVNPCDRPDAATLMQHPFLNLSAEEITMTTNDLRVLVTEMNNQRKKLAEEEDAD